MAPNKLCHEWQEQCRGHPVEAQRQRGERPGAGAHLERRRRANGMRREAKGKATYGRIVNLQQQQALVDAAQHELGGLLHVPAADAGMHLVGWLSDGMDDEAVSRRAAAQGIAAAPLSAYTLATRVPPALVLGYTGFNERVLHRSIRRLAHALHA